MNSFWRSCERPFLLLAVFVVLAVSPARAADIQQYTFALPPFLPLVTTHANWSPFVDRLGRETGLQFEMKLYETMDEFEEDIVLGKPDFVFIHSVLVVAARSAQNYIPLVRNSRPVAGAFVVRKDSPIKTIQDLEGKTVAFVGDKNLCRALLDHALRELHISVNAVFAITANNMLKYVVLSKADAGGALDATVEKMPPDLLDQVRVIHKTNKIAPHALVAHPRVPEKIRTSVTEAVLTMASDGEGRSLMARIPLDSPVMADYDRDYRTLEQMNIRRYFGKGD
ncbi:MAG: phosphate/phosphite/phosphonate ABC transporter substrate-binding protein [Nitrospirota bacterium]|nr:phosphate/phosphite/phosphonate ABC transporter substrate-binding protein [Nitrospirota bacterium]